MAPLKGFSDSLVAWQKESGRHDLPWQGSRDPYPIWVSEIMLQQTRVSTVIPYYERFMGRFPDLRRLAGASLDEVLASWSGLGYYSRARNLHRTAGIVADRGGFPEDPETLAKLPGIGRSTAAAIAAFAFSKRAAILDGNVKRVLARVFGVDGHPGERKVENFLWEKAESLLPLDEIECYTQGLMDLGSDICTRRNPACDSCPLRDSCAALLSGRVHELPAAGPGKALPVRETTFLVLRKGERFCFYRRPGEGIWAELLCFPEIGSDRDLSIFDPRYVAELPSFTHSFTHFRLNIGVILVETGAESGGIWLTAEEALNSSIPKPVRKILLGIQKPSP